MANQFNHIPKVTQQVAAATEQALSATGEYVRNWAHNRCPVKGSTSADGFYTSPWEPSAPGRAGEVRDSIKTSISGSQARVGSNHMIAAYLEFGQGMGKPTSVTAKPYLRPAIENNREQLKKMYLEAYRQAVKV